MIALHVHVSRKSYESFTHHQFREDSYLGNQILQTKKTMVLIVLADDETALQTDGFHHTCAGMHEMAALAFETHSWMHLAR